MLPLGFSLPYATLRLFLSEILDQFAFEASEFTTALWQSHCYKSVMLFCFALSSQNKNLNLVFAHILPSVSVSSIAQLIVWQESLTCRALFLPTSASRVYVIELIWFLKHSCNSWLESTSSSKGTPAPRDCWLLVWLLVWTVWRKKSKAWSIYLRK